MVNFGFVALRDITVVDFVSRQNSPFFQGLEAHKNGTYRLIGCAVLRLFAFELCFVLF